MYNYYDPYYGGQSRIWSDDSYINDEFLNNSYRWNKAQSEGATGAANAAGAASAAANTAKKSGINFKGLGNAIGGFTINNKPLREFFTNMKDPALGWNSKTGLQGFGKNLGRRANIVGGIYHAGKGFGNLNKLNDAQGDYRAVVSDIVSSANNNPLLSQYLNSDQISQVRNLKRHGGDTDIGLEDMLPQDIGDIGGIAKNALLGYLTGGWGGAITQGVGTAFSQGTENALKEQQMSTQELEALLAAVQEAEMQYKSMKRPALGGLGIQQRYLDMYR